MPKKIKSDDWWFKFEIPAWRNSPELRRCSLETRGFWIDCIAIMRDSGSAIIKGTVEDIARSVGCFPQEAARCIDELKRHKTADVTLLNGNVTLKSRKYAKELKVKEQCRLRKQRERSHAPVTQESRDRVKSNKKEVISKKEEEGSYRVNPLVESPPETAPDTKPENPLARSQPLHGHPAIEALRSITGFNPPREAQPVLAEKLGTDVDIGKLTACYAEWRARGYREKNFVGVADWYVNGIPKQGQSANGNTQQNPRQTASERNLERHITNRTLAQRIASGELDEALDAIYGGVDDHNREDPEPRQLTAAD